MIRIWHTVPLCCRNRQRGGLPSGRQYVAKVAEIQKPLANKRFFVANNQPSHCIWEMAYS